jgi:hypothetical protein
MREKRQGHEFVSKVGLGHGSNSGFGTCRSDRKQATAQGNALIRQYASLIWYDLLRV